MKILEQILIVFISVLLGSSLSKIFDILAGRRSNNHYFDIWWSIKFYLAIIFGTLFLLMVFFLVTFYVNQ